MLSLEIARPFGVPVRVHATFVLILFFSAWVWGKDAGVPGAVFGVSTTLALFVCVVLHELGHVLAARRFGIGARQIVLSPLGGVAQMDGVARKPSHDIVIALAGPAVNVVLALLLGAALFVLVGPESMVAAMRDLTPSGLGFAMILLAGNLTLALFNLLPFFPLDGGRVLRAALSPWLGEHRSLRVAAVVGQVGAVALGCFALFAGHLVLGVIAVVLFFGAGRAYAAGTLPEILQRVRAREACEAGPIILEPSTTNRRAALAAMTSSQSVFPVANGADLLGVVPRTRLHSVSHVPGYVVGIMDRAWLDVPHDAPVSEVLERLGQSAREVAAVREDGVLLGFLTPEHVYANVLPVAMARARHAESS